MKGIVIYKVEKTNDKVVQINVREIAKNPSKFEELMDILIAEARKNERKIPWETARKQLKKAGKL
jgi:hypothetical protein